MGGENLAEIQFNNCEMPLEHLIIREDGFRKLLSAFNTQRCMNPSDSLGLAEGAFGEALRYARDREAFGRPIGTMPGKIGRAHVCTPVTNAHLVCRLLLEKKHIHQTSNKTTSETNLAYTKQKKTPTQ